MPGRLLKELFDCSSRRFRFSPIAHLKAHDTIAPNVRNYPVKILFLILLLAPAGNGFAQMTLISASRTIAVSGSADAGGPGGASTYSQTQSPSSQFAPFNSMVTSNASALNPGAGPQGLDVSAMANSRASQDSTISSSQFSVRTDVLSQTSSLLPTWPGTCRGEASSTFEVRFKVASLQTYELTLDRSRFAHSFPTIEATFTLSPVDGESILYLPLSQFSNGQTFTGTLDPNVTYRLNLFLSTISTTPDPFGELGTVSADLTFTVVPEPSSLVLLGLALGTFASIRLARRR